MDDARLEDILEFWFGPLADDETYPEQKAPMWFNGGPQVDRTILDQFGQDLERAIQGALGDWSAIPRGRLATIILLDQFSRNIYRGSPKAFAQDPQALALTLGGLTQGVDQRLRPVEASFFYLPLMHAEDRALQRQSVACYSHLAERVVPAIEFPMRTALDYAKRHQEIIERFGRFPHRNDVLQRVSTDAERAFLTQPGSSF